MISIVPFTAEWATATQEFNQRIESSGFQFPLTRFTSQEEHYLAVEDGSTVRG